MFDSPVRLLAAVMGAVALVAAPIGAALALRPSAGAGATATPAPVASAAPAQPSVRAGFPAPPSGAVVFARQLGADALALGVVPEHGRVLVQASVLGSQGQGASGLPVSFAVGAARANGTACGPGCYRATLPYAGAVDVVVRGTRWHVALPTPWPAADANALVLHAGQAWRALQSVTYSERLASGPRRAVTSVWRVTAPDRIAYQVRGGWAGVIVGARRWDRPPGGRWAASAQSPVTQPQPFWVSAVDAHILAAKTVRGRAVWEVSFFDPGTPAWFDVLLDRETLRTLELHMVTTAHFMHDVYGSFDTTPRVQPPR